MTSGEGLDPALTARYVHFMHEVEAMGVPLYAALSGFVAGSLEAHRFLLTLPEPKRQPNLFFAALRVVTGLPKDGAGLLDCLRREGGRIASIMASRVTQTNEAGRCTTLMAALADIEGPVALIEVGCSAGLCLLPDRYGYDFGRSRIAAAPSGAPVLQCAVNDATPLPQAHPRIVWRAGLDLNPLDAADDEDVAWLRALIFPGHEDRAARLDDALDQVRAVRPRLARGDLLTDLEPLAAEAPDDATLVIFHTAVLYLVDPESRVGFIETVARLGARWVSNEAPHVFPDIAATAPAPPNAGLFLMSVNSRPVAWTDPHGRAIDWCG